MGERRPAPLKAHLLTYAHVAHPPHPSTLPQAKLDALDAGRHFVNNPWHTWEDPEEGGAAKPSLVL